MESLEPAEPFQVQPQNLAVAQGRAHGSLAIFGTLCARIASFSTTTVINIGTLPYYRFFRQNTLLPILHICKCVRRGDSEADMVKIIAHWRERKLYELQYIQVASTILAAGVVGCFSWTNPLNGYWLGPALWYSSLVLSILAILLSSSQAFIFTALNLPTAELHSNGDYRRYLAMILDIPGTSYLPGQEGDLVRVATLSSCKPRWKMVFTWQAPMMFIAYGVLFFLLGLTFYVCTPLFNGEVWTAGTKAAYFYFVIAAIAGGIFSYCSFWAYKFIDLDTVTHSE